MALLWGSLLLVAARVSAVQGWPEDAVREDPAIDTPQPLRILEEDNLKVLTPAGLSQMLNQTRFLMVLFRECPSWGWARAAGLALLLGARGALANPGEHVLLF